jgi:hypothetical protein
MSNRNRSVVLSDEDSPKKRKKSSRGLENRYRALDDAMADTDKKGNFSALIRPNNNLISTKPGAAKKLVILNFKGLLIYFKWPLAGGLWPWTFGKECL